MAPKKIELKDALKALKELAEEEDISEAVEGLYIFGSLAREGSSHHDIDIAVKFRTKDPARKLDIVSKIVLGLAKRLGVNEDQINVVDLDTAPLALKLEIAGNHVVAYGTGLDELKERALIELPELLADIDRWAEYELDPRPSRIILESRAAEIRRNAKYLAENVVNRELSEILSDYGRVLAWERAMYRLIEAMLDVCRHLVSVHGLGVAESYGEYPLRLAERRLMPRELAEQIRWLIGLRNIIVHRYAELDYELMHRLTEEVVRTIVPGFLDWVGSLLEDARRQADAEDTGRPRA